MYSHINDTVLPIQKSLQLGSDKKLHRSKIRLSTKHTYPQTPVILKTTGTSLLKQLHSLKQFHYSLPSLENSPERSTSLSILNILPKLNLKKLMGKSKKKLSDLNPFSLFHHTTSFTIITNEQKNCPPIPIKGSSDAIFTMNLSDNQVHSVHSYGFLQEHHILAMFKHCTSVCNGYNILHAS